MVSKDDLMGKMEVYNLDGSIFKWANEDRLLVTPRGDTVEYVHPYNTLWGTLCLSSSKWNFGYSEG